MALTYQALATVTVGSGGASNIEFTSIPQTYTDLLLVHSVRSTVGGYGTDVTITINGSTSDFTAKRVYGYSNIIASDSATRSVGTTSGTTAPANTFATSHVYFYNYASTTLRKLFGVEAATPTNSTTDWVAIYNGGLWSNTSAITSISFRDVNAPFVQYSTATLYGIKNA